MWKYRRKPLTASTVPRQLAGLKVKATLLEELTDVVEGRNGIRVAASSAQPNQSA